jgi:hypothetical protein
MGPTRRSASAKRSRRTSTILGQPRATRAQLRRHLIARHDANPGQSHLKDSTLLDIVTLYDKTCRSIGLDPLVATSQMELEIAISPRGITALLRRRLIAEALAVRPLPPERRGKAVRVGRSPREDRGAGLLSRVACE